jgi:hypothetical protein
VRLLVLVNDFNEKTELIRVKMEAHFATLENK